MRKGKYEGKDLYLIMKQGKLIDSINYKFDFGRYKKSSVLEVYQGNGLMDSEQAFRKFSEYLNDGFLKDHHINDPSTLMLEAISPVIYKSGIFYCNESESYFQLENENINRHLNIIPLFNDRTFLSQQMVDSLWNFRDFCYYSLKIRIHYTNKTKNIPQGDPTYIKWLITHTSNIVFEEDVLDELENQYSYVIGKVEALPIGPGKYKLKIIFERKKFKFGELVKEKNLKKLKNL